MDKNYIPPVSEVEELLAKSLLCTSDPNAVDNGITDFTYEDYSSALSGS